MARPIKLTADQKLSILASIGAELDNTKMTDRGLEIKKKFSYNDSRTCTVEYTPTAWFKTIMLIDDQSKEVGWHGVCHRDPEDETVFHITDILLYPQKVTGASVNPDAIEYANWMQSLDDDTFNNMRAHIHSHVNMGVTPSGYSEGCDLRFREDRLSQLGDDEYYIFQIMNKRGDISSAVYDLKNNVYYENDDVETVVDCEDIKVFESLKNIAKVISKCNPGELELALQLCENSNISGFLKEASEVVKPETPAVTAWSGAGYRNWGDNRWGSYGQGYRDYRYVPPQKSEPKPYKPRVEEVDDEDEEYEEQVDEYLRTVYGDDFADTYGESIKNDPFFASDSSYRLADTHLYDEYDD